MYFGVGRAIAYPFLYNKKLKKALQVDRLALYTEPLPSINNNGNGLELTLVKLRF
jgi:hypothetical protein